MEIRNAKTLTTLLKNGKYLEKEKLLLNLSDLTRKFIFSKLKACFANPFPKSLIGIFIIYLHHLGECIEKNKASDLTLKSA